MNMKPCPFCGSENLMISSDIENGGHGMCFEVWNIYCYHCKMEVTFNSAYGNKKEDVIKAWNIRVKKENEKWK